MSRPEDALYRLRVVTFALLRLLLFGAVLLGLLVGPLLLLDSGVGLAIGMALFTVALFAVTTARPLPLYAPDAFGVHHRVDEDTFDGSRKRCTECGRSTTQGLRRRYARQFVCFGVPLHTLGWGVNEYCLDCAEPGGSAVRREADATARTDDAVDRELERAFE
ncbi:hypothetical protein [Halovivax limisalsi]|uniref:hypothetical protein n=1 Tax=Halovivax limisalsi TaxID=1453760 RepID=UPI001FFC87B8|nr:hypothetical protein [Halovivax limisalsi]